MGFFKKLQSMLGLKPQPDLTSIISNGAKIIDVRTPGEFLQGHIVGATNVPLDVLNLKLSKFKKDEAIITCCASGMRSKSAQSILQSNGFTQVYNGGGWRSLTKYIK